MKVTEMTFLHERGKYKKEIETLVLNNMAFPKDLNTQLT